MSTGSVAAKGRSLIWVACSTECGSARTVADDREIPPEVVAAQKKLGPEKIAQINQIMVCFKEFFEIGIKPEFDRLSKRIADLESAPVLRDCGVWKQGMSYGVGAVVTDHGSAFVAKRVNMTRPFEGNDGDWRLLVKRGRDGKNR